MNSYHIMVTGPFASGKTQFIQTISEIDVYRNHIDIQFSREWKVGPIIMDCGRITLNHDSNIYLFNSSCYQ
jgi:signal recognition particle receptor subunit beta